MKNKLVVAVTLLSIFASGCKKDKEETVLNVVYTQFDITEKGGTGIIVVETNATLSANSDADWCKIVDVSAGTVVNVTVDANNGLTDRTATVTLSAGDKKVNVPVTQEGAKRPSSILTYEDLLGEYTLTAKLGGDYWYETETFTSTLRLEPLEEGVAYLATIDNYILDEAFFGYYGGEFEQYPFIVIYYEGSLIIPNFQPIGWDTFTDEETGDYYEWVVVAVAVSSDAYLSSDDMLFYEGIWNESLTNPVFTFSSLSPDDDFEVIGFIPYWINIDPDDEELDGYDPDLLLYDWVLTKNEPIP